MAGTLEGQQKTQAARFGLTLEQYRQRLETDKWCTGCKAWHDRSAFGRDSNRGDGLASGCLKSRSTGRPRGWHGRQPRNPMTGRPGPAPNPARDGDRKQARQRINVEVRTGRRPRPDSLPCADCGHVWKPGERRHEYDHYRGYEAAHHFDVQPVCTTCHHERERSRG